jgi:hypothetical protein
MVDVYRSGSVASGTLSPAQASPPMHCFPLLTKSIQYSPRSKRSCPVYLRSRIPALHDPDVPESGRPLGQQRIRLPVTGSAPDPLAAVQIWA